MKNHIRTISFISCNSSKCRSIWYRQMSGKLAMIHAGLTLLAPSPAMAATLYWDNNGVTDGTTATPTGTWGTSNFWNTDPAGGAGTFSSVTTASDDVIFSAGTTAIGTYTVTVSGSRAIRSITVEDGLVNLAGTSTPVLTTGTGGVVVKDSGRLGGNNTLTSWLVSGSQIWTIDSNAAVAVFNPSASTALSGVANTGNISLTLTGSNATMDSVLYRGLISNGTGNTLSVIKDGTGTWNLQGANTYSGGFTLKNGMIDYAIASVGVADAPTSGPFGTGILTVNGGDLRARAGGKTILNRVVVGGDFSIMGNNVTTLAGSMNLGGGNRKITVAGLAATQIISGVISNGGLTKAGPYPLSLTANNTYAGPTLVSEGTLSIGGSGAINSSSGISVSGSDAKLLYTSSVASTPPINLVEGTVDGTGGLGALNVADSAFASLANGNGGFGRLATGNLNFAGRATVNVNISQNIAGIAAGELTTSGTDEAIAINVRRSGAWNNGLNNLISFTSFPSADVADFVLNDVAGTVLGPRQQLGGLVLNGNNIALEIIGDPVRWTGLESDQWTINTVSGAKNWKLSSDNTATDYLEGDDVVFDDTPGVSKVVQMDEGDVYPATTTFNNSTAVDYTLASAGGFGIAGGSLLKNGTGTVTLATGGFYTGQTVLNNGRLNFNHSRAIGTGELTINGGVIGNTSGELVALTGVNPQNWNADITFVGPNDLDMGTGPVTVGGVGTNRSITVNSGTLTVGELRTSAHDVTKLGTGSLILSSNGAAAAGSIITGTLNVAAGSLQIGRTGVAGGDLTVSGLVGSGTITNGALEERLLRVDTPSTGSFDGTLADGPVGSLGLHKQGAGSLTLTGSSSYTGATTVAGGLLVLKSANSLSGDIEMIGGMVRAEASGALGVGTITIRNLASGLQLQGGITLSNDIFSSNDGSGVSGYAIANISGNNTLTGNIRMRDGAGSTSIQSDSGSLLVTGGVSNNITVERTLILEGASTDDNNKVTGVIQNGNGVTSLQKRDAGKWTLEGMNTYTGTTRVTQGILSIAHPVLGDNSAVIVEATGAVLHLAHASTDQVGSLVINGQPPKANGVYDATTDPGFITGPGKIRVGPPASGYTSWASGFPFTAGVNDGPGHDADGDGIKNLLEYVLGGIPAGAGSADTSILPSQVLTNDDLVLTFHRSDISENDVVVKVQWSTNLEVWNDFVTVGPGDELPSVDVTEDSPSATLDTVVIRIPRTLAAGAKLFGRVVATKP